MARRLMALDEVVDRSQLARSTLIKYEQTGRMPLRVRTVRGEPRWGAGEIRLWLRERGPRRPPKAPRAACGTPAGWRAGCGCDDCTEAHNAETRHWRRDRNRLPEQVCAELLKVIASGLPLPEAVAEAGLTQQRVHGQARVDPEWRRRLDTALLEGRDPSLLHGVARTYRHARCRCPDCREAHRQVNVQYRVMYRDG